MVEPELVSEIRPNIRSVFVMEFNSPLGYTINDEPPALCQGARLVIARQKMHQFCSRAAIFV